MIRVILRYRRGDLHHTRLPQTSIPYQIDTAAWMGLKRIRERHPDLPAFEGLDVFLDGSPVHTDDSEKVLPQNVASVITLVPRTLKLASPGPINEAAQQFFIIE